MFTQHPFNGYLHCSPLGGIGIFAKEGGLQIGDALEFSDGNMSYTWSDPAFWNGPSGFAIHLKNGRCYLVDHMMDYRHSGSNGAHLLSANFCNATARYGQVIDQHIRYPKPHGYTKRQIQKLYREQTAIIGCLKDDEDHDRFFLEVVAFVEAHRELCSEYDVNCYNDDRDPRFWSQIRGFAVWTDDERANWALRRVEYDPASITNLAIAILDMVRRDLDAIQDMDDDEFHTSWFFLFIALATDMFAPTNLERSAARARLGEANAAGVVTTINRELFYYIPQFTGPIWVVLSEIEVEITTWIHVQWQELAELNLRDDRGMLQNRPTSWRDSCRPWSIQWWSYLRRLDGINEQRNRPYYINHKHLGDVRGLSEWNVPYGINVPVANV